MVPVAVVGGGIGGLTAAAALSRAGVAVRVYEQTARLGEIGAGLQLAPNATRVLRRLDVDLDAVAVRPSAIELRRWDDGSLLGRTELGARCEEMYGAPYLTVHRADLHRSLAGDSVELGRRCVGVGPHGELLFSSGEPVRAGVVVGADGIHSVVRAALVEDRPRFSGKVIYRGLVTASDVPCQTDPRVLIWLGPDRHLVCYPVRAGELVSFAAALPGVAHGESWREPGRVADLAAAYAGWCTEATQVIAAAGAVSRWALHDRDTVSRWGKGNLTLLGDAAHPMLPFLAQGANQAIEDAATLAACLRDEVSEAALRRYEQIRMPRTAEVHRLSRTDPRDLGDAQSLRNKAWLYGYDASGEQGAAVDGQVGAVHRGVAE